MKKPLLIGCGVTLALGIAALSFGTWKVIQKVSQSPAKIEAVADRVLGITAPSNFEAKLCIDNVFGVSIAVFSGPQPSDGFVIAEFPFIEDSEGADWKAQIDMDWADGATVQDQQVAELRFGEVAAPVDVQLLEIDGKSYRVMTAHLQREGGHQIELFRSGSSDAVTLETMQADLDRAATAMAARGEVFVAIERDATPTD